MASSNRRLSCAVTFDLDAMSVWIGSMKSQNPSMISRGEFGAVASVRILELLRHHRILTSWCIPGHTVLAYPDLVRRIHDEGHEIVHHGWVHENPLGTVEANLARSTTSSASAHAPSSVCACSSAAAEPSRPKNRERPSLGACANGAPAVACPTQSRSRP